MEPERGLGMKKVEGREAWDGGREGQQGVDSCEARK